MLTAALLHRLKRRARTSFPAVPGPSDFFRRPPSGAANRALFLALSFTLVYALFFIARVGGDFMYARFVIPLVPFLYFSGECFLRRALRVRPRVLAAALVAVPLLVLGEGRLRHALYFLPDGTPRSAIGPYGVTDERWYYTNTEHGISLSEGLRDVGSGLARYFEGTNVRVLLRSQATLGYYGRFATCIESNGLTDATIARTPSVSDRPGHQKLAPRDYLARRGVHFVFLRHFEEDPWRSVYFRVGNEEVRGELITWDAALMHRLRERFPREVRFTDFDQVLDRWIADAPGRPAAGLRRDYERFREFYFLHNPDPEREAKILRLLAGSR